MYAKYAFGSFTVGVQESEQEQSGATTSDDDDVNPWYYLPSY